jgi:putative peptidoglycan lipid II flippase
VVLLPVLSRHLRAGEDAAAMATLNRGIELVLLLTMPAAVALIAIPYQIVSVLFQHGNFTAQDSLATAIALGIYGAGLPAFVLVKALTPAYYAREDTATPFRYAVISMIVNTILSVVLFYVMTATGVAAMAFAGIALGTILASWLNIAMLSWTLHKRGHLVLDPHLRARLPRILISSLLMGFAVWAIAYWPLAPLLAGRLYLQAAAIMILVLAGLIVFGALALLTGGASATEFRDLLRGRRPAA